MKNQRTTPTQAPIGKNRYVDMSRRANRARLLLGVVTAGASVALVAGAYESNPDKTPTTTGAKVTCKLPVHPGDTLSGLADTFMVGQNEVTVSRNGVPESRPAYQMQPGDVAAAKIGVLTCREIGGDVAGPMPPNVAVK